MWPRFSHVASSSARIIGLDETYVVWVDTLVRSYGLKQEFITPHCPQKNGMIERVIRTLKEQCVHRHRLETLQHASRVITDWIGFYNYRRPHQALAMKTPTLEVGLPR